MEDPYLIPDAGSLQHHPCCPRLDFIAKLACKRRELNLGALFSHFLPSLVAIDEALKLASFGFTLKLSI